MGCFNKTGFFSNLPIQYEDRIILLFMAHIDGDGCTDVCPVDSTSTGYVPLALPFHGSYDDYGGIENTDHDVNYERFKTFCGKTVEEMIHILYDLGGRTYSSIKKSLKDLVEGRKDENTYHNETIESYQFMIDLMDKIYIPKISEIDPNKDKRVIEALKSQNEYNTNRKENMSIVFTMEHEEIYNELVNIGRGIKTWYTKESPTIEDSFDYTVNFISKCNDILGDDFKGENPLKLGIDIDSNIFFNLSKHLREILKSEDTSKLNDIKEMTHDVLSSRNFIGYKLCLHCTVRSDDFEYAFYNDMKCEINEFKDIVVNFAYFLRAFERVCTQFNVSSYHSQDVDYDTIIKIKEKELEIIKSKFQKTNSEEY